MKNDLKTTNDKVKPMKKICDDMGKSMHECQQREECTTDKLLNLEARSMRDTFIFYGIQEVPPTLDVQQVEHCEQLVKELISTKLQLDATTMVIDRALRLGSNRARKPRTIVVKFHKYNDREVVRVKSYEDAIRATLTGSNRVGTQSPQQYREARKALHEYAKREEDRGQRARIIDNKLYVNNRVTNRYSNGNVDDQ